MKVFNIGIPELVFLGLLALIVLGPERIVKTARSLGIWVRKATKSPLYQDVVTTSQELRDLPRKIMRESGLEEPINEINKTLGDHERIKLRERAGEREMPLLAEDEGKTPGSEDETIL